MATPKKPEIEGEDETEEETEVDDGFDFSDEELLLKDDGFDPDELWPGEDEVVEGDDPDEDLDDDLDDDLDEDHD